jgi:hypothetical protein
LQFWWKTQNTNKNGIVDQAKLKVVRISGRRGRLSICVFVLYFLFVSKNTAKKNGVPDENT